MAKITKVEKVETDASGLFPDRPDDCCSFSVTVKVGENDRLEEVEASLFAWAYQKQNKLSEDQHRFRLAAPLMVPCGPGEHMVRVSFELIQ